MVKTPEDTIKKKCLGALQMWQGKWCTSEPGGLVIDYDDVSALGKHFNMFTGQYTMNTKKGKRDIIAWFRVGNTLWTYLIECKSEFGTQRPEQIEYERKWQGLKGVVYEVVYSPDQIHATLDRLTGRTSRLLQEAGEWMEPKKRKGIWLKKKSANA